MPAIFNGQLRPNVIYNGLFNMVISQQVFSDNVKGTNSTLVDRARVDGNLYGDTKTYYSVDVLESHEWGADSEAANLLDLDRPEEPKVQSIVIDKFRQIRLSLDNYLTKQAWMSGTSFSDFTSVMIGMMGDTKRIYDSTLYNTYIGTTETDIGRQAKTVVLDGTQKDALVMAEELANELVDLTNVTYDYNDYMHTRSYDEADFICVWNADYYNKLKYVDLPTIFHKEGLLNKFEQVVLPPMYFGTKVGESGQATTNPTNITVRSLIEKRYTIVDPLDDPRAKRAKDGTYYVHVFPGQLLPGGVQYNQNEAYNEDGKVIYKLIHKRSVPYMSAFSVGSEWWNPRALVTTRFLTFGHNTLEYLKNYPYITLRSQEA